MIASNLGQIIGRLMNDSVARSTPIKRTDTVISFVRERGEVGAADLQAIGISQGHSYVLLNRMARAGQLKRIGRPYHFRYTLP